MSHVPSLALRRERATVRNPGRCSLNDMRLFSTPLYIGPVKPHRVCFESLSSATTCTKGAWLDSLPNYHLLSPITQCVLYEQHKASKILKQIDPAQ